MNNLKDAAKVSTHVNFPFPPNVYIQTMVSNVTSLLKTVRSVENEQLQGTRALEAAIDAINLELKVSEYSFHFILKVYV